MEFHGETSQRKMSLSDFPSLISFFGSGSWDDCRVLNETCTRWRPVSKDTIFNIPDKWHFVFVRFRNVDRPENMDAWPFSRIGKVPDAGRETGIILKTHRLGESEDARSRLKSALRRYESSML